MYLLSRRDKRRGVAGRGPLFLFFKTRGGELFKGAQAWHMTELFILSDPIWVGDLNEPKKPFV
jgi:hypothetical protein